MSSLRGKICQTEIHANDLTNGVVYDKYSGQGWNIAYGMDLNNISAAEVYGTNVELVNGMVIIFDFSPYTIYEVHTDN